MERWHLFLYEEPSQIEVEIDLHRSGHFNQEFGKDLLKEPQDEYLWPNFHLSLPKHTLFHFDSLPCYVSLVDGRKSERIPYSNAKSAYGYWDNNEWQDLLVWPRNSERSNELWHHKARDPEHIGVCMYRKKRSIDPIRANALFQKSLGQCNKSVWG